MILSDTEVQERYITWRSDPLNDRCDDSVFCSENSTSLDRLRELKTLDVIKEIASLRSSLKIKCPRCDREIHIFIFTKR